jgi:hypothetical protein
MTNRVKLAISVPADVAEGARAAVAAGEAPNVSAYFAQVVGTAQRRRADLERIHSILGEPPAEAIAWAERALGVTPTTSGEQPGERTRRAG